MKQSIGHGEMGWRKGFPSVQEGNDENHVSSVSDEANPSLFTQMKEMSCLGLGQIQLPWPVRADGSQSRATAVFFDSSQGPIEKVATKPGYLPDPMLGALKK